MTIVVDLHGQLPTTGPIRERIATVRNRSLSMTLDGGIVQDDNPHLQATMHGSFGIGHSEFAGTTRVEENRL